MNIIKVSEAESFHDKDSVHRIREKITYKNCTEGEFLDYVRKLDFIKNKSSLHFLRTMESIRTMSEEVLVNNCVYHFINRSRVDKFYNEVVEYVKAWNLPKG